MSGSNSITLDSCANDYRWSERWASGLLKLTGVGLLILACGFYVVPHVAKLQTAFYLTLLLPALLLLMTRRDLSFLLSWQFVVFCTLPLLLAISSLWASSEEADIQREFSYYLKVTLYLALFYVALYLTLEKHGDKILVRIFQWLIPIGIISCAISLINYVVAGGLESFRRIGGISLEGDIDKTGMLYGFLALFCCYGLTLGKYWRWLSWTGLLLCCIYILLSQTKIPIVMVLVAIILATLISGGSRWLKALLLVGGVIALPLIYLAIYGDLPLLHRDIAYSARIDLWLMTFNQFAESPLVGSGLMYKQFLNLGPAVLPHPHNYLFDIARFTGLIGVTAALAQLFAAAWPMRHRRTWTQWIPGLYAIWLGFGVLAMLIYAQQPLVKPSYIWFFYWIPLAVLLARSQLTSRINADHPNPKFQN
ncbi:O-antigen ligase family protein [Microbulbifer harenosus]|uniref:O-antigen ligase family protein n=1 Tax=Microbulbifer harenosus TaxID=2576840 RepID=A0ABY2UMV7_9GAMM|nr:MULTISPECIES: O-antigen ligase family protein [Microbulbifer]QIL91222.1 hypothetical protein GNX18_16620 [Microbulbifer sp. SH-1]TLM77315.1 O-antigen ligase family protein [Microbulbifer harenosus]